MEYFTSMDFSSWPAVQAEHRQRYTDLKTKYIDEPARRMTEKADDVTDNNPLALSENVRQMKMSELVSWLLTSNVMSNIIDRIHGNSILLISKYAKFSDKTWIERR